MATVTNYDALRGPEKAAIMFLCLGEERGANLMQNFSDKEIQDATVAMAGLGAVSSDVVERVIEEFRIGVSGGGTVFGSLESAERMLLSIMSRERVDQIMGEIRGPIAGRSLWDNLSNMSEQVIASYLASEHDQAVAVVLSKLKPDTAAKVIAMFGYERSVEIADRMMNLGSVPRRILDSVEQTLTNEFLKDNTHRLRSNTTERMADMFNKMDGMLFERIATELEERSPDTFKEIKSRMFTFEDLRRLERMALSKVIAECAGSTVAIALRGASKEVRKAFLAAMTSRARELLETEMEDMGPVRAKDVQAAQSAMVDKALEMIREEVIQMPLDEEDLV